MQVGAALITDSVEENLLGISLNKHLYFKSHVNSLCKKARQKLHALARISSYVDVEKFRIMMNTLVISQFSYCPLVWMFHDRSVSRRISKIHLRALRISYKDSCSNFEELLLKANTVSIHHLLLKFLKLKRISIQVS